MTSGSSDELSLRDSSSFSWFFRFIDLIKHSRKQFGISGNPFPRFFCVIDGVLCRHFWRASPTRGRRTCLYFCLLNRIISSCGARGSPGTRNRVAVTSVGGHSGHVHRLLPRPFHSQRGKVLIIDFVLLSAFNTRNIIKKIQLTISFRYLIYLEVFPIVF